MPDGLEFVAPCVAAGSARVAGTKLWEDPTLLQRGVVRWGVVGFVVPGADAVLGRRLAGHRMGARRLVEAHGVYAGAATFVSCESRKWLPDGSRKPQSMPYGRSSGGSVNSTPRALSVS